MNSELKALFGRLGPIRDISHDRSFSDEHEPVLLRRDDGPFVSAINVAKRLFASGMQMRAAHRAINDLAAQGWAMVDIPIDGCIDELASDLPALKVHLSRRREFSDPSGFIANVRERHKLSQRDFATALGLDVRTLQNWEQGRNRPETAVLTLVRLFDRNPELVRDAVFEPVA